jgi:hypothetical protein
MDALARWRVAETPVEASEPVSTRPSSVPGAEQQAALGLSSPRSRMTARGRAVSGGSCRRRALADEALGRARLELPCHVDELPPGRAARAQIVQRGAGAPRQVAVACALEERAPRFPGRPGAQRARLRVRRADASSWRARRSSVAPRPRPASSSPRRSAPSLRVSRRVWPRDAPVAGGHSPGWTARWPGISGTPRRRQRRDRVEVLRKPSTTWR